MRILLLNPNTTPAITDRLATAASAVISSETHLVPLTAPRGVPYIATRAEAQIGGAIALEMLAEHHTKVDAAIIAAFGDPGLLAARELFDIPVIGMAEAAMLSACMLGRRFAIVTFATALGPWYQECVEMHGLTGRCAGIRMLEGTFGLAARVKHRIPVPVVDQVQAAVKQAEALVALGVRKATAGTFRRPAAKPTIGLAPALAARIEHKD